MIVPLTTTSPSSLELRRMLRDMVNHDLVGPAGGPEEEVVERSVRSRYLIGQLAPPNQFAAPEEQDDLAEAGSDEAEEGSADSAVPGTASMLPSSIGLTFSVSRDTPAIQITARWGQYERIKSEVLTNKEGNPKLVWKRRPAGGISDLITLREGALGPWYPEADNEGIIVRGLCRAREDSWVITLFLVNAYRVAKDMKNKDQFWLFQPELEVAAPDGGAVFVRRGLPDGLTVQDDEDRAMGMLYRQEVEFAVGHGVGVHADLVPGSWDCATRVRTRVIPAYEVELMDPPTAEDYPLLGDVVLDMKALSETETGTFTTLLAPLADAYEQWIAAREAELDSAPPDLAEYRKEGTGNLARCREALARIRAGIAVLDDDVEAAEAFRFANAAMHQQRVRSIYAASVRQGQEEAIQTIDQPKNRSWRPFQLAFLLLNLPALADPTHAERDEIADLLWFPTGGGKTEAYLGVAAFTMGIRRLQGQMEDYGPGGVTVLMRYTLRLLTLQQFQRATALIAACELIRRHDPDTWGEEPFRIGLWVGQSSTPNWTSQAAEAIKERRNDWWSGNAGGRGTPAQLTNCPWCGQPIDPGKDIIIETDKQGRGRTLQYCGDKFGTCPFSRKQAPDEGLPIVVVDEEIYRLLPTLLIATVDKFAQMPWKGQTQMLFGKVTGRCPRHGYLSPEIEDNGVHRAKGSLPATTLQEVGPLRPPDLIIQDELHLISGPLGTLVGLYETAVDELSAWSWQGHTIRPKVIASTATVRRARQQIHNLFLRQVRVFPPSGLSADDNFFSLRRPSTEKTPGRLYLGICAPGVRLKTVLIQVYVALMAAAQTLYEDYGEAADPWMTLVGYFSSMRELGGMRRVADDAVRTRLTKMDERGLARRFINPMAIEELTSRKGAADIPKLLDRLEVGFSPAAGSTAGAPKAAGERQFPLDLVLATNMISVGVDVSRLGLMVVAGQPKATAEYIQATSRVGRRFPGLVCTVYNWARPRDLSHYERFEHYHATFYQQVEALSVTPFAPRALDRGLSGVLVSLLRLQGEAFNANQAADRLSREHPYVDEMREALRRRAASVTERRDTGDTVSDLVDARLDEWLSKRDNLTTANLAYSARKGEQSVSLLHQPNEQDWDAFTCLNSLRDVEPSIKLILDDFGMDRAPGSQDVPLEGDS